MLEKDDEVSHSVSAQKPKMLDNTNLSSCSATRLTGKQFITLIVSESIDKFKITVSEVKQ